MAVSPLSLPGILRVATQRDGVGCMKFLVSGSSFLECGSHLCQHGRFMRVTPALNSKNLLKKFASKSKKKFWYDSPSLGNQFVNRPDSLASLMKVQRKEKREDTIRMRALNVILYKALTDLLKTSEVSQEVYDLNVELSKVSVSVDFSVCRAYWMTSGCTDTDSKIENVLQKYAPRFRHLMLTYQVLGSVPPVVFVRDKEDAMIQEVEKLLATADFGEDHNYSITCEGDTRFRDCEPPSSQISEASAENSPFPASSMFGIDHVDFNKQIMDYKRKTKDKLKEASVVGLSEQQQEQLAEIRKQKMLKKKMKKHKGTMHDDDVSPQTYLLSKYSDMEEEWSNEKDVDYELQESINELEEVENVGTKTSPCDQN
ncbi:putative ribosome-binding factor A, mitochondrial [Rhinophrynus dorsalis]